MSRPKTVGCVRQSQGCRGRAVHRGLFEGVDGLLGSCRGRLRAHPDINVGGTDLYTKEGPGRPANPRLYSHNSNNNIILTTSDTHTQAPRPLGALTRPPRVHTHHADRSRPKPVGSLRQSLGCTRAFCGGGMPRGRAPHGRQSHGLASHNVGGVLRIHPENVHMIGRYGV